MWHAVTIVDESDGFSCGGMVHIASKPADDDSLVQIQVDVPSPMVSGDANATIVVDHAVALHSVRFLW